MTYFVVWGNFSQHIEQMETKDEVESFLRGKVGFEIDDVIEGKSILAEAKEWAAEK